MKQVIFRNWNLVRALRLAMGVAIIIQAVMAKDILFGMIGALFTAMPVFNLGCCATGNCAAPPSTGHSMKNDIHYEEVV